MWNYIANCRPIFRTLSFERACQNTARNIKIVTKRSIMNTNVLSARILFLFSFLFFDEVNHVFSSYTSRMRKKISRSLDDINGCQSLVDIFRRLLFREKCWISWSNEIGDKKIILQVPNKPHADVTWFFTCPLNVHVILLVCSNQTLI